MIDENLPRWIRASVNKYFNDALSQRSLPIYVEGMKLEDHPQWVEVRTNGPVIKPRSQPERYYELELDLMCAVKSSANDLYALDRLVGFVQSLIGPIVIRKLGDGANDNNDPVGCITLRSDVPIPVDVAQWGLVSAEVESRNASVIGYYKLEL